MPSRVRKATGEGGSRTASRPGWASCSQWAPEKGNQRGSHTETKPGERQRPRKRASRQRKWEKEERPTQDKARGCRGGGPCRRAPTGGGRKKEETKNKRRETKGQWESIPPYPNLRELWGCRGDCLQGSERRGEGGANAGGPGRPSRLYQRGAEVWGSALRGAPRLGGACSAPILQCHSLRTGWDEDKRERLSFPLPGVPAGRRTRDTGPPASHPLLWEEKLKLRRHGGFSVTSKSPHTLATGGMGRGGPVREGP